MSINTGGNRLPPVSW